MFFNRALKIREIRPGIKPDIAYNASTYAICEHMLLICKLV